MSDALINVPVALIVVAFIFLVTALLGGFYKKVRRDRRNMTNLHRRRKLSGV